MKQNVRGFSLIEAIISLAILMLTIGAFISLMTTGLNSFDASRRSTLAGRMAQEGMELAISKRNNHVFCIEDDSECPTSGWKDNLLGSFQVESADVDLLKANKKFKNFDPDKKLCILEQPPKDAGRFGYCSGSTGKIIPGNYTREVEISAVAPQMILVKVTVKWERKLIPQTLVLEEVLFGTLVGG